MSRIDKEELNRLLALAAHYHPGSLTPIPAELLHKLRRTPCAFSLCAPEKQTKPEQKMVTCNHGKTLTMATARRVLGLPS